ncbi:MAG: hypothetical protein EPN65_02620 [Pandoraea sp.]|nr:MAG: hypothetical protein EPN65_02620 [Pandoraea sp.]
MGRYLAHAWIQPYSAIGDMLPLIVMTPRVATNVSPVVSGDSVERVQSITKLSSIRDPLEVCLYFLLHRFGILNNFCVAECAAGASPSSALVSARLNFDRLFLSDHRHAT